MSKLITKVQWAGKINSFALVDITDWTSMIITRSTELKSNSAEITLLNPLDVNIGGTTYRKHVDSSTGNLKFNQGDAIKIYASYVNTNRDIDSSATSNDLLMSAEVQEVTCNLSEGKAEIRLKCVDRGYIALQKLWAFAYQKDDTNAPDSIGWRANTLIQNIMRFTSHVYDRTTGKTYFDKFGNKVSEGPWEVDARLTNEGGFIDATRPDGSAFPTVNEAKTFKPVYEWFDELSSPELTNDFSITAEKNDPPAKRKYMFFIDELNRLHWFYPADETIPTITITAGSTSTGNILYGANLTYATYDIVNMVIWNAGDDMNGSGILNYYYNKATKAPNLQMVYKAWTDIARNMKAQEFAIATQKGLTSITRVHDDQYDYPISYTSYNGANGIPVWAPTTSIASNSAYNTSFRSAANAKAQNAAEALTNRTGSPRWRGTLTLKGNNFGTSSATNPRTNLGALAKVTILDIGVNAVNLRIKQMQHNINRDDWQSILTVEQDEQLVTLST